MSEPLQRLLKSCLAMAIVVGIFLVILFIVGVVVFGTQLGGL